jgi:hypothetical protein
MPHPATPTGSAPKPRQLLLRLPDDLAQRFAQLVPSRQRSRFLLNLLRTELDRESQALAAAAKTLTAQESAQWVEAPLTTDDDADFDAETFEREFAQAQAAAKTE